jgi:two-component system, OmpR family, phosphate regulon sensor histidine kinase PhoR
MALRKSPRGQSLLIATILLLIYVAGCAMLFLFGKQNNPYWQAAFGAILFLSGYIVVHKVFLNYVEKRLNPIYKTIQNVTLSRKKIRKSIDSEGFSEDLDKEVKVWATNQTNEIRQLKEMERYRKDFLGNVSHELKTPIFNIQGYILTLLDGGIDDPKINTLYLKRAEKSVNRMISIVDDLVSMSRLESGEFKLQIENFNIVKLVEEVFESHEMLARKYRIKLEFDGNYNKPVRVFADKRRITEVLNNLIVNSIKYGSANGKTRVGFDDTGETILVDITDNGIGIAEEDLPRIFERFYRVDKSRSRDSGGTGLGLAIVKHIIQAHNQSINVRSGLGKGTSFVFSLDKP